MSSLKPRRNGRPPHGVDQSRSHREIDAELAHLDSADLLSLIRGVASSGDLMTALARIGISVKDIVSDVDQVLTQLADASTGCEPFDATSTDGDKADEGAEPGEYWSPLPFYYSFADSRPLGTITLLRLRSRPRQDPHVVAVMDAMRSVLTHALMAASALGVRPCDVAAVVSEAEWVAAGESLGLTRRQREVVASRMTGLAYKQIADRFGITDHCVKRHMSDVYLRTSANGHADLVALCLDAVQASRSHGGVASVGSPAS